MTMIDENFYFSQSSLQVYRNCPLKFRLRYIDGLYWPVECDSALKLSSEIGKTFHLVAQRYFLGIFPGLPGGEIGTMMEDWYNNLVSEFSLQGTWLPEMPLRLNRPPVRLTATFDVLHIPGDGTVSIYDWKTGEKPPRWKYLRGTLQTIVYRYLMAEAGEVVTGHSVAPENIRVIYWNPRFPGAEVIIKYSEEDYYQDEKVLSQLVSEIVNNNYADFSAASDPKMCTTCEYRMTCSGQQPEAREDFEEDELLVDDWDEAPEIAY